MEMNQLSYDEKVHLIRQRFRSGKDLHTYLTTKRKCIDFFYSSSHFH